MKKARILRVGYVAGNAVKGFHFDAAQTVGESKPGADVLILGWSIPELAALSNSGNIIQRAMRRVRVEAHILWMRLYLKVRPVIYRQFGR